jgi:hypothetical protein
MIASRARFEGLTKVHFLPPPLGKRLVVAIVRSESEFRGDRKVSAEKEGPPLPFRLKPYKVKKIDKNGQNTAKIIQNCKKKKKKVAKSAQNRPKWVV